MRFRRSGRFGPFVPKSLSFPGYQAHLTVIGLAEVNGRYGLEQFYRNENFYEKNHSMPLSELLDHGTEEQEVNGYSPMSENKENPVDQPIVNFAFNKQTPNGTIDMLTNQNTRASCPHKEIKYDSDEDDGWNDIREQKQNDVEIIENTIVHEAKMQTTDQELKEKDVNIIQNTMVHDAAMQRANQQPVPLSEACVKQINCPIIESDPYTSNPKMQPEILAKDDLSDDGWEDLRSLKRSSLSFNIPHNYASVACEKARCLSSNCLVDGWADMREQKNSSFEVEDSIKEQSHQDENHSHLSVFQEIEDQANSDFTEAYDEYWKDPLNNEVDDKGTSELTNLPELDFGSEPTLNPEEFMEDVDNKELFSRMFLSSNPEKSSSALIGLSNDSTNGFKESDLKCGMLLGCKIIEENLQVVICERSSKALFTARLNPTNFRLLVDCIGLPIRWLRDYNNEIKFDIPQPTTPLFRTCVDIEHGVRIIVNGVLTYIDPELLENSRHFNVQNLKLSWPVWIDGLGLVNVPFSMILSAENSRKLHSLAVCTLTLDILFNLHEKMQEPTIITKNLSFQQNFGHTLWKSMELKKFDDLLFEKLMINQNGRRKYIFKSAMFPLAIFEAAEMFCQPDLEDVHMQNVSQGDSQQHNTQRVRQYQGVFFVDESRENTWCALVAGTRHWLEKQTNELIYNYHSEPNLSHVRKTAQGEILSRFSVEQLHAYVKNNSKRD